MKEIQYTIDCLKRTPLILNALIKQIPAKWYKSRRVKNKWSIHEQVCHLTEAQNILINRFRQFEKEENPVIKTYEIPIDRSPFYYLELNMDEELQKYGLLRDEMITMLKSFDESYWERKGYHDMFSPYNTKILLTHALNVDYAHIFSIEQLGLTKSEFENGIITIP